MTLEYTASYSKGFSSTVSSSAGCRDVKELLLNSFLPQLVKEKHLTRASTAGSMLGNEISVAFSSSKNIKEAMTENNGGIATSSQKPVLLKKAMSRKYGACH
eukprot:scaffold131_cov174-Ochromonas_danica.AAC.17